MNTSAEERNRAPTAGRDRGRVVLAALAVACVLAVIPELLIDRHEKMTFAASFGFYAWYAFAAGVVLVGAARLAQRLLARSTDYYGDGD